MANSNSSGWDSERVTPFFKAFLILSSISLIEYPRETDPKPLTKSSNILPSTSSINCLKPLLATKAKKFLS